MTRTTVLGHDYVVTSQGYQHADDCATCRARERAKNDALYQADLERACGCCEPEAYDYE